MKEKLKQILEKYKINVTDKELEEFNLFNINMLEYNKIHNITNITEENEVILKHYLDSILPYKVFSDNSKIIDLGCGGGFPSIPLKIINKSLNITAVDSVTKKTDFVSNISKLLNLDNFNVIHSRIEDLAYNKEHRENYDYVISRAVAPLSIILEYSAPFAKNNGYIICYKGNNYQNEILESKNALKILNCKIEKIEEYYIEEIDTFRYILIIKKINDISMKYPRKQNKPRLKPLN